MPPTSTALLKPLLERHFTRAGMHPFDQLTWEKRSSKIVNEKGETVFELKDAEIPANWAQLATDIVVSKYFRKAGVPETGHEVSVRQVVKRIAHSIRGAGEEFGGYFGNPEEAETFEMELSHLLVNQMAAFNSPVWFNCGLYQEYGITGSGGNWFWDFDANQIKEIENSYQRPQCSACFIQAVEDDLMKMFDVLKAEARLFKYGSGTGSNFSKIRAKGEKLGGGGSSSGLLSFLKVFDAGAGAIKSGGTTRRAAKMVCIDMDHPDIEAFINWKVNEEKKVAALIAGGYSADFNGEAYATVTAQNANTSVRLTDEFLNAVENGGDWQTTYRTTGKVAKTYQARELWDQIAKAAWQCADPGVQYDTTINQWHTCSNTDRINASNPCSEYMFLDDSACNLASINLLKFIDEEGAFDIEGYRRACRTMFIAQEILVDFSSYPTKGIAQNSHDYRPLGLGYANLGTVLMRKGIPYDSPEAVAITGSLTAIMTGQAYAASAEMAARKGAFAGFAKNREPMLKVMRMHRDAAYEIDPLYCPESLLAAAQEDWDRAVQYGEEYGYRNAQATVIAPTGTIGLLMDCDTTSIEPGFALVMLKKLAGGGYFKIVNQSVPPALENLGYNVDQISDIVRYMKGTGSLEGSPFVNRESLAARGLTREDIAKVEAQLPTAFETAHAFNRFNVSKESLTALGLSENAFDDQSFDLLKALGFSAKEIEEANKVICGMMTVEGAPHLNPDHLAVFDCANKCGKYGTRFIAPLGHLRIMAAAQPFISGAISKTVNLPNEATVEEIEDIYLQGWKMGLKAVALYRDGSKLAQVLNTQNSGKKEEEAPKVEVKVEKEIIYKSERRRLPDERRSLTHKFSIGGHEGYITVGLYDEGNPGEIFINMAKQGSVISGMMDAFATSISIALQYNVPLEVLVSKFSHMRFEPSGMTNNPNIRLAKSIVDYIFRWMGMKFLDRETVAQLGIHFEKTADADINSTASAAGAPLQVVIDGVREKKAETSAATPPVAVGQTVRLAVGATETEARVASPVAAPLASQQEVIRKFKFDTQSDAPSCSTCGGMTVRNGSCYLCRDCGATSGCS